MKQQNIDRDKLLELLGTPEVPEDVHNDILLTCMTLPRKERKPRLRTPFKAAGISFCSIAAAFLLLIGINAANPVFAENLPLVGSLFRQYNAQYKNPVGTNIDTYGKVETIETAITAGSYDFTLLEAYSDGNFLHFSYELEVPQEYFPLYDILYSEAVFTVNGQEYPSMQLMFFNEGTKYAGTGSLELDPNTGEKLEVSYALTGGRARFEDAKQEFTDIEPISLSSSFQVTADPSNNRTAGDFTGTGEVKVLSVETTPSYTKLSLEIPFWGVMGSVIGTDPVLLLPDGTELAGSASHGSDIPDPKDLSEDATRVPFTVCFDGAPKDTDTLILRFYSYDDFWAEGCEKVIAEVTVNLADRTYTPTSTYLEAGMKAIEDLPHSYQYASYDLITDELWPQYPDGITREEALADESLYENGFLLSQIRLQPDGKTAVLFYSSDESYRAVDFDLIQDGQRIAHGSSSEDSVYHNEFRALWSEERIQEWREYLQEQRGATDEILDAFLGDNPGCNVYSFKPALPENYVVGVPSYLTLRLTDSETGELLFEKEIRLVNKNLGDELDTLEPSPE